MRVGLSSSVHRFMVLRYCFDEGGSALVSTSFQGFSEVLLD